MSLQSLTATYTDSEGEEEEKSRRRSASEVVDLEKDEKESTGVTLATPESNKSGTNTPHSGSSVSAAEIRRVAARLVSYNNDEAMSGDEDDDEEDDSNSRVEFPIFRASRPVTPDSETVCMLPGEELLPPEPAGKCSSELQEKITRHYENMMHKKIDMNFSIQQRKQFRNPSIYEKLIDHLDIEEIGTNYPTAIYDPYQWNKESYYENLSKVQREEMEKREKERRDRTKVEFVSGTAAKKNSAEEEKKRKSKWDQTIQNNQNAILTTVATGTKTAIPAFGTLPKKAKQV